MSVVNYNAEIKTIFLWQTFHLGFAEFSHIYLIIYFLDVYKHSLERWLINLSHYQFACVVRSN